MKPEALQPILEQLRDFEHGAHLVLRWTDLRPKEKQAHVAKHGFADCVTARPLR